MNTVDKTNLPFKLMSRGKVRDVYDLDDKLLMIATDRISVFDVVLPTLVPYKGTILTQLSNFWFSKTSGIMKNHIMVDDFEYMPADIRKFPELRGRSVIVKKAQPLLVECVVRGYITGSAWSAYKKGEPISGITLPEGLVESDKLPEPLFTPTSKAATGHDEAITEDQMREQFGDGTTDALKKASLDIYNFAEKEAKKKGIIIADTKFEFGILDGNIIVIDEMLTPDSSRFWPADSYKPGVSQKSFDKQFVRDYMTSIGWNKEPPVPQVPENIVAETTKKYIEAYEKITGKKFALS
jgi:phosphoribosylaminoimidazole-succinocarboxamide synthase